MSSEKESITSRVLKDISHVDHADSSSHDPNGERWLVSYADMMTLLFGFFVLLYVFSEEPQKLKESVKNMAAEESGLSAEKKETDASSAIAEVKTEKVDLNSLTFRESCRACFQWDYYSDKNVFKALGVDKTSGYIITEVDPFGPAASAGFKAGDILSKINDQPVTLPVMDSVFFESPTSAEVHFELLRKSGPVHITVKPAIPGLL